MTETPAALGVIGIDHVEIWVGNAHQAAHYYQSAFGFSERACAGPETGMRDRASRLVAQGKIRLLLTGTTRPEGEIPDFVRLHGDAVRNIVFEVSDAEKTYDEALRRGAVGVETPRQIRDGSGSVVRAGIRAYGDVIHTFLQRDAYGGPFLPGFEAVERPENETGLLTIDHIVANVEEEQMETWVDYYRNVFGFGHMLTFDDRDISTEHSALRSKVMASPDGAGEAPDQRARPRASPVPDPGIPGLPGGTGRAAHRPSDRRHHHDRRSPSRARRFFSRRAACLLRGPARTDRDDR